jgi:hypothetical protein
MEFTMPLPHQNTGNLTPCASDIHAPEALKVRPQEDTTRLNTALSRELAKVVEDLAELTDSIKTAVIRQAIALMRIAHEEKKKGRHLGFVDDSRRLDIEIIGGLHSEAKTTESESEKVARIQLADWAFWMGHFWTLPVVVCLAGLLIVVFDFIKDPDISTA